jgi:dihydrofolate reductase
MGEIVVQEFVTLDGVAQGPGGPDEDVEGGFEHGGWQMRFGDPEDGAIIGDWESRVGALLLGRKTYDIWAPYWGTADPDQAGPFGDMIRTYQRVTKYIASRTLRSGSWEPTVLLGDGQETPLDAAALDTIRHEADGEVRVWGSTGLVTSLAELDAVDEYRLLVHPLVLGTGKRLFGDGFPVTSLRLVEARVLQSGIIVQIYRRASEAA